MFRKGLFLALAAFAAVAYAATTSLGVELGTIGSGATATWVNTNPHGNGKDKGHQAIELCKNVPTSEWEAAGVDITGVNGTPVTSISSLCFTAVTDITSTGSPRWDIYFGPNDGNINNITGVAFLGSTATAGQQVCYDSAQIQAALTAAGATSTDVVKYLQVIQDEQGCTTIDNIMVTIGNSTTVFNGNGKNPGKARILG